MVKNVLHHLVIFVRRYANKCVRIPLPTLVTGAKHVDDAAELMLQHKKDRIFVVTDKSLVYLGLVEPLLESLRKHQVSFVVFDQVTPDPTIELVEQGVGYFKEHRCDAIIALGGGSVIDCAKAIAASVIKKKPIVKLGGLFKVRRKLPYFIAIPTTAGTGSETTIVAVVTDAGKQQKFTIVDPCLVPDVALLDASLMIGLPADITAATGIDALTHAIESYIGLHSSSLTQHYAESAIKRIFEYLPRAYEHGDDVAARTEMSLASYYAGVAFTRTSIGYVHAIAHQLGAVYHIPHGLANAVLLPHILEFSYDCAKQQYAEISFALNWVGKGENVDAAARLFLDKTNLLLATLNIPSGFIELKQEDIYRLSQRAIKEAFCQYPVPRIMTEHECSQILHRLIIKN